MCRRRREGLNPSSILLFHRLANHPALRASNPRTSDPLTKLRKSRSEMGTGFVLGSASSRSSPSSQVPQQPTPEFGYRTVALQKAREAQSKMKRSRTINFQQFYTSASSAGTASVGSGNATSAAAGGHRSVPPPSAGLVTNTCVCVCSFDGFLETIEGTSDSISAVPKAKHQVIKGRCVSSNVPSRVRDRDKGVT